ncbi:MAG: hypothetical protein ACRD3J_15270 [Thermoanaerobaculia bacterium]
MKVRRIFRRPPAQSADPDLATTLAKMSAPELRAFVHAVVDGLEDEQRTRLVDSLMARASRGTAGWKPDRPSSRIVNDAKSFSDAARRVGYADPADVTAHLRLASRAFLAGDHANARAVFEALLLPIATVDIDLGQHELVDDVLNVDVHACIAQYVTSVYTTTPIGARANAVFKAIEDVKGVGSLLNPIQDMESMSAGALPDLGSFLPRWVKRLGRLRPSKDEWESDEERWLREAVFRLDGVDGLAQLARKTRRPQTCLAWCEALVNRGDWAGALRAYDGSAALVGKSHWRGEFLDGGVLAAQQLKRPDVAKRLEAAWQAAPTLIRLMRWLVPDGQAPTPLGAKAKKALARCPKTAGRQLGLLRLLRGGVSAAADLLSQAPGLGWSSDDHPGHVLFPSFAILLANRAPRRMSDALLANVESTCRDPLAALSPDDVEGRPRLSTPSIVALIQDVSSSMALADVDRNAMTDAMRIAAEKRVEGILGNSRRRHYGHAAMLVGQCVAVAPAARRKDLSAWLMGLRQTYSRRHAFRQELMRAMESLGVSPTG